MRTHKDIVIDGTKYTLAHWDVLKSTEIWAWLVSSIGPAVRGAYLATKGSKAGLDMTPEDLDIDLVIDLFDSVVGKLSQYVSPKDYADRIAQILSDGLLVNGQPVQLDFNFSGRLKHLHSVVLEVLKYQYADFFGAVQFGIRTSDSAQNFDRSSRVN